MPDNVAFEIAQNVNSAVKAYTKEQIAHVIGEENFQDHYPAQAFMAAKKIKHEDTEYLARRVINSSKTTDEEKKIARKWLSFG